MMSYWQNAFGYWGMPLGMPWILPLGILILTVFIFWSLVWKGMALWKAARSGDTIWFVVLLVVNTLGILEILYIYVFSKKSEPASPVTPGK